MKRIPTRKHVAAILRGYRIRAALSQEDLGFAADLSRNYVGMVERGERNPTFESLARWLRAVKATWTEFGADLDGVARSTAE